MQKDIMALLNEYRQLPKSPEQPIHLSRHEAEEAELKARFALAESIYFKIKPELSRFIFKIANPSIKVDPILWTTKRRK